VLRGDRPGAVDGEARSIAGAPNTQVRAEGFTMATRVVGAVGERRRMELPAMQSEDAWMCIVRIRLLATPSKAAVE